MKNKTKIFLVIFLLILFTGCDDENGVTEPEEINVTVVTAKDINANGPGKTYYRFRDSTVVTGSDTATANWDVAFSSTTIYTNSGSSGPGEGGAVVLTNTDFLSLSEAPAEGYEVDGEDSPAIPTGSGNGWYLYDFNNHAITPIPGVVLVIKTGDGKYAKMQIESYYKGAPETISSSDESGYYTFQYYYQPDGSRSFE